MSTSAQQQTAEPGPLPLVLLPGTLCDARIFDPLLERLPRLTSHVLLTLDATTMPQAAEQVLAQTPECFAILGFSLGGIIATEIALRAPHRVRGLALLSATPRSVPVELHAERRAATLQASTLSMCDFVEQQLWPGYTGESTERQWLSLLQGMAEAIGPAAFRKQTELALSREDLRHRLGSILCPTLLVAGDRDLLCPPAAQDELAAALPHATRLSLKGAGHLALLERPDEVAHAVAAWLETTEQEHLRRK